MKVMIMKKIIKRFLVNKYYTNLDDIIASIQKSECLTVSFDIFDTLIKRNVQHSQDVYVLLEKNFFSYFSRDLPIRDMRIQAETIAVQNSQFEDVNLMEIYDYFDNINREERNWLIREEISIEKAVCQRNYQMAKIYDWCIEHNKNVIITSDMYLPKDVIVEILEKAGYHNWRKIYISNDLRAKKTSGKIFDIVLQKENISPNLLVHIGDALKGDYLAPRKKGICAILIRQDSFCTKYENNAFLIEEEKEKKISYNVVNSFVKNNVDQGYTFYQKLGYEVVGPILYGYCKWLKQKAKESGIEKIYFLAREGVILKRAFEAFGESHLYYEVIWVSRKATAIPLLYKTANLQDLLSKITVTRANFTIWELLNSCGISDNQINEIAKLVSKGVNEVLSTLSETEKATLFTIAKPYIDEVSKAQKKNIIGYLNQFNFGGNIAVCDVGWHGTIQNALQDIFDDSNIVGYYIGKKEKKTKAKACSEAFLFDDGTFHEIGKEIMSSIDLFELFFLSTDGSAKSYNIDAKGNYYCVKADPEQSKENSSNIVDLQEAAYKFVNDFRKLDKYLDLDMNPKACAAAYSKFINPPTMETVNQFKKFSFLNVGSHSLVASHGLRYYMIRPKKFISEFLNNGCKSLFLKSIFIISLPYVDLIDFMRKFDKR